MRLMGAEKRRFISKHRFTPLRTHLRTFEPKQLRVINATRTLSLLFGVRYDAERMNEEQRHAREAEGGQRTIGEHS